MKKKTYKGWVESNSDLDEYLAEPCVIDDNLYNYIRGCTIPQYSAYQIAQGGDCIKEKDGVGYYMTVSEVNDKYFYLGILPEFVQ